MAKRIGRAARGTPLLSLVVRLEMPEHMRGCTMISPSRDYLALRNNQKHVAVVVRAPAIALLKGTRRRQADMGVGQRPHSFGLQGRLIASTDACWPSLL